MVKGDDMILFEAHGTSNHCFMIEATNIWKLGKISQALKMKPSIINEGYFMGISSNIAMNNQRFVMEAQEPLDNYRLLLSYY